MTVNISHCCKNHLVPSPRDISANVRSNNNIREAVSGKTGRSKEARGSEGGSEGISIMVRPFRVSRNFQARGVRGHREKSRSQISSQQGYFQMIVF